MIRLCFSSSGQCFQHKNKSPLPSQRFQRPSQVELDRLLREKVATKPRPTQKQRPNSNGWWYRWWWTDEPFHSGELVTNLNRDEPWNIHGICVVTSYSRKNGWMTGVHSFSISFCEKTHRGEGTCNHCHVSMSQVLKPVTVIPWIHLLGRSGRSCVTHCMRNMREHDAKIYSQHFLNAMATWQFSKPCRMLERFPRHFSLV